MTEIKLNQEEKEIAQWLTLEDIDNVERYINTLEFSATDAKFVYERLKAISTLNRYKAYLKANLEDTSHQ